MKYLTPDWLDRELSNSLLAVRLYHELFNSWLTGPWIVLFLIGWTINCQTLDMLDKEGLTVQHKISKACLNIWSFCFLLAELWQVLVSDWLKQLEKHARVSLLWLDGTSETLIIHWQCHKILFTLIGRNMRDAPLLHSDWLDQMRSSPLVGWICETLASYWLEQVRSSFLVGWICETLASHWITQVLEYQ